MSAPEDKWVWFDEPDPKPKDVAADVPLFVPPAPDPSTPAAAAPQDADPSASPEPIQAAASVRNGLIESEQRRSVEPKAPTEDLRDLLWGAPKRDSGFADPFAPLEWPDFAQGPAPQAPKVPTPTTAARAPEAAQEQAATPIRPKPVEPIPAAEQSLEVKARAPRQAEPKLPAPPQTSGRVVLTSARPVQGRPELRPSPVKPDEKPSTASPAAHPAAPDAAQEQSPKHSSALVKAILLHLEGKIDQALGELNSGLLTGENPLEIKAALGNLLYEAGRFEDATRNYGDVLAQQPQHPGIHYRLAVCLHRMERLPEALAEFRQAAALSQTDWEARLAIGVVLLEMGNPAEALPRFEECVAARPREVTGLLGRGIALEQLGRILDAESTYRAAMSLDPSSTDVRRNLLSICLARESTTEARKLAEELMAQEPQSRHALEALVTLEMTEGNYLKARDLCEALVRQEPEFFEAWFNYGICLRTCQNTTEAAAAFGEAARLKSDSLEAQMAYAIALREGGDSSGAAKVIADALRHAPSDPRLLVVKAGLAIDAGDLETVEKIVVGIPTGVVPKATVEALEFQYGCLLLETGDLSGAVRVFEACLKRRPDWSAAHVNHGLALWHSGDGAGARKALETALACDPKRPEALSSLAYMAIEQEDYERALEFFLKLIATGDRKAEVFYNAGLLQQYFGKPQEALDLYAEALKENPGLSEALERMGQVASTLGRNDEAKEYWKKAKQPIILGGLAPA
jgi:Flp pilus assembly protein TadD